MKEQDNVAEYNLLINCDFHLEEKTFTHWKNLDMKFQMVFEVFFFLTITQVIVLFLQRNGQDTCYIFYNTASSKCIFLTRVTC